VEGLGLRIGLDTNFGLRLVELVLAINHGIFALPAHRPDLDAFPVARTRGLAEQAIFNFENSPRTKFANQLQTSTDATIAGRGKGVS